MGQDQMAVTDPAINQARRAAVAEEACEIIDGARGRLEQRLAEALVGHRETRTELSQEQHEHRKTEDQRKIANEALGRAIKTIGIMHAKRRPSHKSFMHAKCPICAQIRILSRQEVRSSKPESRMSLAS